MGLRVIVVEREIEIGQDEEGVVCGWDDVARKRNGIKQELGDRQGCCGLKKLRKH